MSCILGKQIWRFSYSKVGKTYEKNIISS